MVKYKLDTETYTLNADRSQLLDFHRPIAQIQWDLSMTYTSDATAIKYDGHPGVFLDQLKIGEGSRFPVQTLGRDLYYLHWLFKNTKPTETKILASQAGVNARARYTLPIPCNRGAFVRPKQVVEWVGDLTSIGGLSAVSGTLNGAITFSENPVPEYSLVPDTTLLNKSGGDAKIGIPAEGRLSKILTISRIASTKLAGNTALDDVNLRLEGIIEEERQFSVLEAEMQELTDDPLEAGVALIDLKDILPLIGNSSYITVETGGTAVDLTHYFIFEGVKQAPAPTVKTDQLAAAPPPEAPATRGGLPSTVVLPRPPNIFRRG